MPKQIKFKVENHDGRWWVMRRKKWDIFSRTSNHRTEELAYRAMRNSEREEMQSA